MAEIQLLDGSTIPLGEDPYGPVKAGIEFNSADVLGRRLKDETESKAFVDLVNMFFGSEFVYNSLRAFIEAYFETHLEIVKEHGEDIVPSSNGEDSRL